MHCSILFIIVFEVFHVEMTKKSILIYIYIAYRKDALSLIEEKEWQYANKDIKKWERE